MINFILNEKDLSTPLPAGTSLLDLIRYNQGLTGTKIGCREGDCGACTVLVGEIKNDQLVYSSATSCLMAIGNASGKHIVTIEGLNLVEELNVVQQAFSDEAATQCGFCTPGFIVSLTGFCIAAKPCNYNAAIDAVNGNICRCTGYKSIERAANIVNEKMQSKNEEPSLQYAIDNKILPAYFSGIKERLSKKLISKSPPTTASQKRLLAGGTDLYVQQHESIVNEQIDFLFDKTELKSITQKGNICVMGASVTVADIAESKIFQDHFSNLAAFVKLVSSTQIRNMATVAGNFINASPIGDLSIFFLALNAQLVLSDGSNTREIALRNLYKGYKSLDKLPEEWIEKIWFELPATDDHFNFEKVCKRSWLDIATVNTAIFLKMKEGSIQSASITAGGVGPVPAYLSRSSHWLIGKKIEEINMVSFFDIVQSEISPISDVRGTEAYKRLLLTQLIKAHFVVLFPQMQKQIL